MPVQQFRDALVFERFALHHMAPMASGITHGKENRLVFAPGFFEGFIAPRVPIDRDYGHAAVDTGLFSLTADWYASYLRVRLVTWYSYPFSGSARFATAR